MLCVVLGLAVAAHAASNAAPVIGVLAQPIDASVQHLCPACSQYTVGSYVQWIQAAGARVALLQYNGTPAMLSASFAQLSGLVIPGGHVGFHTTAYGTATAQLLQLAAAAGDFPVWGTCQGFQQLAQYGATGTGMHPDVLTKTGNKTDGIALPLDFAGDPRDARVLADAPQAVLDTLGHAPITLNLHHYSVLANATTLHPALATIFRVVATNTVGGDTFISLMEGQTLPWYASQFHPEKNAFEWDQAWCSSASRVDAAEAHSAAAIDATGWLARFFVGEARRCSHRWSGGVPGSVDLSYDVRPPFATRKASEDKWEQVYLQ